MAQDSGLTFGRIPDAVPASDTHRRLRRPVLLTVHMGFRAREYDSGLVFRAAQLAGFDNASSYMRERVLQAARLDIERASRRLG